MNGFVQRLVERHTTTALPEVVPRLRGPFELQPKAALPALEALPKSPEETPESRLASNMVIQQDTEWQASPKRPFLFDEPPQSSLARTSIEQIWPVLKSPTSQPKQVNTGPTTPLNDPVNPVATTSVALVQSPLVKPARLAIKSDRSTVDQAPEQTQLAQQNGPVNKPEGSPNNYTRGAVYPDTWPTQLREPIQPAQPPVIKITIGRIDVRAITPSIPTPTPAEPQPRPVLSLEDYLKQRNNHR